MSLKLDGTPKCKCGAKLSRMSPKLQRTWESSLNEKWYHLSEQLAVFSLLRYVPQAGVAGGHESLPGVSLSSFGKAVGEVGADRRRGVQIVVGGLLACTRPSRA